MISITRWISAGLRGAVATGTLAMMALTAADVAGRYFFSAPLHGASELIGFALGLSVMSAMPLVSAGGSHIAVSLLAERLSPVARRNAAVVVEAVCIAGVSLIAAAMLARGAYLLDTGERTQILRVLLWPGAFAIAGLWGAVVLAHLVALVRPPTPTAREEII